jgi:hypothetical protein
LFLRNAIEAPDEKAVLASLHHLKDLAAIEEVKGVGGCMGEW